MPGNVFSTTSKKKSNFMLDFIFFGDVFLEPVVLIYVYIDRFFFVCEWLFDMPLTFLYASCFIDLKNKLPRCLI